ncbi:hypothetical protein BC833DRAFT_609517, partial [Globomyces pollinis-pini]
MIFKSNVLRNHENYFSIGQLLSDLSLSFTIVLTLSLTLNNSLFLQEHTNCQIIGFLLNFLALVPLFFALNIPTSAYRIIVKGKPPLNFIQTILRTALIISISGVVAILPIILHIDFAIQDNQGYCFYDFYSSSVNHNISIIASAIAFALPTVVVAYVYYSIWKRLHNTIRPLSLQLNYTLQITVARRGALVYVVYMIGYAFPITYNLYKGFTKKKLPVWMDNTTMALIAVHACINPIVYYLAEPRVRCNRTTDRSNAQTKQKTKTNSGKNKQPLVLPFYKKAREFRRVEDISDDSSSNLQQL